MDKDATETSFDSEGAGAGARVGAAVGTGVALAIGAAVGTGVALATASADFAFAETEGARNDALVAFSGDELPRAAADRGDVLEVASASASPTPETTGNLRVTGAPAARRTDAGVIAAVFAAALFPANVTFFAIADAVEAAATPVRAGRLALTACEDGEEEAETCSGVAAGARPFDAVATGEEDERGSSSSFARSLVHPDIPSASELPWRDALVANEEDEP